MGKIESKKKNVLCFYFCSNRGLRNAVIQVDSQLAKLDCILSCLLIHIGAGCLVGEEVMLTFAAFPSLLYHQLSLHRLV